MARPIRRHGDGELLVIPSRFDFSDNLRDASSADDQALARFIADSLHDVDVVMIDCAPTESVLTRAAYHASRYVLVPVRPEFFATIGFPLLQRSLEDFRGSNPGHEIDVLGVVVNNAFYDGGNQGGPERKRAMAEIRREAAKHRWRIFQSEIPFSRGFPKMMRGDHAHIGNADEFYYLSKNFAVRCRRGLRVVTGDRLAASLRELVQEHGIEQVHRSLDAIARSSRARARGPTLRATLPARGVSLC